MVAHLVLVQAVGVRTPVGLPSFALSFGWYAIPPLGNDFSGGAVFRVGLRRMPLET